MAPTTRVQQLEGITCMRKFPPCARAERLTNMLLFELCPTVLNCNKPTRWLKPSFLNTLIGTWLCRHAGWSIIMPRLRWKMANAHQGKHICAFQKNSWDVAILSNKFASLESDYILSTPQMDYISSLVTNGSLDLGIGGSANNRCRVVVTNDVEETKTKTDGTWLFP